MGLMGLGKSIVDGVVALRYEVNVDQAKAAIKDLSGEQKKAAKETAEAYKQQNEAFKKHVADFGKGAAIIGTALLVAKTSWTAYRDEAKLSAGAAGVSIDKLSESYSGLKSRMELLTLAQAGHQGAWKLTTGQLQQVIEGMRALEKKGHDSQQVFEKFTEVIKKGKLEGLDDFGISLKATGDKSKDLQILMRALGREVMDVGGQFSRTGDEVVRATVRMEDGISRVRSTLGAFANEMVKAAADLGESLGRMFGGNLNDPESGQFNARDQYSLNFARLRAGQSMVPNGAGGGAAAAFLAGGAQDADFQAADALGRARGLIRRANAGSGPLASMGPADYQGFLSGLPQGWQTVDPVLAAMAENLKDRLDVRMVGVGKSAAASIIAGLKSELAKNASGVRSSRRSGRGGRGRADAVEDDWLSGALGSVMGTASAFGGYLSDTAAASQASQDDALAAYQDRMSQRFADAQMVQDIEADRTAMAKQQKESFLERTFGKLEEFDAYAAGFGTLKNAVTDGFAAWISGSESLGTAIKKSIATSLAAYAVEMSGRAIVAGAHALFNLATGDIPGATAMGLSAAKYAAAAAALGVLAKGMGTSAGAPSAASSAAGVGGRPSGERIAQSGVVIVGDPLADDSARERARRVRRAMRSAGQDAEGVSHG